MSLRTQSLHHKKILVGYETLSSCDSFPKDSHANYIPENEGRSRDCPWPTAKSSNISATALQKDDLKK